MEKGTYGYSKDGYRDHTDAIHKSWPWDRLTEIERGYVDLLIEAAKPTSDDYDKAWDKAAKVWEVVLKLISMERTNKRG